MKNQRVKSIERQKSVMRLGKSLCRLLIFLCMLAFYFFLVFGFALFFLPSFFVLRRFDSRVELP